MMLFYLSPFIYLQEMPSIPAICLLICGLTLVLLKLTDATKTLANLQLENGIGDIDMCAVDDVSIMPSLAKPFITFGLSKLPGWMPKFPKYNLALRIEVLAFKESGTEGLWPNCIFGIDISKNTRLNAKFFFPIENGIQLGSYHNLSLKDMNYGCNSEYLFPANQVNALAINALPKLEKAVQNIHTQFDIHNLLNNVVNTGNNAGKFCARMGQMFTGGTALAKENIVGKEEKMNHPRLLQPYSFKLPNTCAPIRDGQCRNIRGLSMVHTPPLAAIISDKKVGWSWP